MKTLTRLKQTRSIEDYKTQFENLSNRLKGLSDSYKLSCFLSGFHGKICLLVCKFNPHNLLTTYKLAKIQEETANLTKKTSKWPATYNPKPGLLKPPIQPPNFPK